jgi:hypothetical protein
MTYGSVGAGSGGKPDNPGADYVVFPRFSDVVGVQVSRIPLVPMRRLKSGWLPRTIGRQVFDSSESNLLFQEEPEYLGRTDEGWCAMGRGLDQAGREYIRDLVERKQDGEYVKREINRLLKGRDWDFGKNEDLVKWLRRIGWKITAEYLWNHISGR